MWFTFTGIVIFLILILIAIRLTISKQKSEEESGPQIHTSGIYSVVRRSPKERINEVKPGEEEIRKYLSPQNEDINGDKLTKNNKEELIKMWDEILAENIMEIEKGDQEGIEFYYFDIPENDVVCRDFIRKGEFITREEIHNYPDLIPPFHIGCISRLKAHHGVENLQETTKLGLRPFFKTEGYPPLPDWKQIIKITGA